MAAMGFWQGLNEGITYVLEKKAREREIEQQRQDRKAELQQQIDLEEARYRRGRADQLEDEKRAKKEAWVETLLPLYVQREQQKSASLQVTPAAASFFQRFSGVDDPKLELFLNNPTAAAEAEAQLAELEKKWGSKGLDFSSAFSGKALLDMIEVSPSGSAAVVDPRLEDFMDADTMTVDQFAKIYGDLTSPLPGASVTFNPKLGVVPESQNLAVGEKYFQQQLILAAQRQQETITDTNSAEWSTMKDLIDNASKGDLSALNTLQNEYGYQVYKEMAQNTDPLLRPYLDSAQVQPLRTAYETEQKLRDIVTDPNSTETQKADAAKILEEQFGVILGGNP